MANVSTFAIIETFLYILNYWKVNYFSKQPCQYHARKSEKKAIKFCYRGQDLPRQRSTKVVIVISFVGVHMALRGTVGGTSLVGQWLRIRLPVQGTRVQPLVREDPTCCRETKPTHHNYWARMPRARAPQQEKPLQWEAHILQQKVAPAAATRESPCTATKTQHSQK